MPEKLLNIDEAAAFLGVSKSCLYKKVAAGDVPCTRIGRAVRFHPTVLNEWAAKQMGRP